MDLVSDWRCNGFKVCDVAAIQVGHMFDDMGVWLHTFEFSGKESYWEFRFYNTSLN